MLQASIGMNVKVCYVKNHEIEVPAYSAVIQEPYKIGWAGYFEWWIARKNPF